MEGDRKVCWVSDLFLFLTHLPVLNFFFILYAVLSYASSPAIISELEQEGGRHQTQLIGDRFWCCQLVEVYCVTSVFSYMNHKSWWTTTSFVYLSHIIVCVGTIPLCLCVCILKEWSYFCSIYGYEAEFFMRRVQCVS